LSGYVQLGVNAIFILASVRLALHYLSNDEYALWMPATVIAGYIALMDFGLSNAAARILIDYKDHRPEEYGSIIQTSAWVAASQGALIFLIGILLAFVMGPLLHIQAGLRREFFWLIIGQCGVTAAMFATRIVSLVLTANQRFDISNCSSAFSLVINFGVMWWGFAHGVGVFSMVWGQVAAVVTVLVINWAGCRRLKLLPPKGQWGHPTWQKFHELFIYGRDIFLFMIGNQLVNVSQTLLLTRLIGLNAALTWGICTRALVVLTQVIARVFDYSTSALAEMMVRGERENLLRHFREIEVLSVNLAVAAGVVFAIINGPFVRIWTEGRVQWSPLNDVLLAIWLVVSITVRVHTGFVGQTKVFQFMRYIYFIEGLAFIGLTILLYRFGGITMMLVISILCSLCCTFQYGLWRTRECFHLSWADLARWHQGTLMLAGLLAPAAALLWWFARNLPTAQRLMLESTVLGLWATYVFLRFGLGAALRAEMQRRAPAWARPIFGRADMPG
jgi:O-antigen/teichoic acid export membrane protein